MKWLHKNRSIRKDKLFLHIKSGVECIEILAVKSVSCKSEAFTEALMDKLREKGVQIGFVTLHVGLGTFRPVKADRIDEHVMHSEFFSVSEKAAETINRRRAAGGRTICVGTTSCRTLESASDENGTVRAMSADTGIFIYPGYKFKILDYLKYLCKKLREGIESHCRHREQGRQDAPHHSTYSIWFNSICRLGLIRHRSGIISFNDRDRSLNVCQ